VDLNPAIGRNYVGRDGVSCHDQVASLGTAEEYFGAI
jgi:hypothetical protein